MKASNSEKGLTAEIIENQCEIQCESQDGTWKYAFLDEISGSELELCQPGCWGEIGAGRALRQVGGLSAT